MNNIDLLDMISYYHECNLSYDPNVISSTLFKLFAHGIIECKEINLTSMLMNGNLNKNHWGFTWISDGLNLFLQRYKKEPNFESELESALNDVLTSSEIGETRETVTIDLDTSKYLEPYSNNMHQSFGIVLSNRSILEIISKGPYDSYINSHLIEKINNMISAINKYFSAANTSRIFIKISMKHHDNIYYDICNLFSICNSQNIIYLRYQTNINHEELDKWHCNKFTESIFKKITNQFYELQKINGADVNDPKNKKRIDKYVKTDYTIYISEYLTNKTHFSNFISDPHILHTDLDNVIFQIVYSIKILSDNNIIHNDLHGENIFIVNNIKTTYYYVVHPKLIIKIVTTKLVKIFDFDYSYHTTKFDPLFNEKIDIRSIKNNTDSQKFDLYYFYINFFLRSSDKNLPALRNYFSQPMLDKLSSIGPDAKTFYKIQPNIHTSLFKQCYNPSQYLDKLVQSNKYEIVKSIENATLDNSCIIIVPARYISEIKNSINNNICWKYCSHRDKMLINKHLI